MTGILALYGSGEFTAPMIEVDNYLLGATRAPAVAILPTAAGLETDYRKWIDDGLRYYQSLGVEVSGIEVVKEKDANDKKLVKELGKYTYFVFSGGDPGHLLDTLRDSLVWNKIVELHELGATLVGSSAGAMVFGDPCWARIYELEQNGVVAPWERGLALTDFGVIPHFDFMMSRFTSQEKRLILENIPKGKRVVGIDEDTAYIRHNDEWIKKGKGKVHDPITEAYV